MYIYIAYLPYCRCYYDLSFADLLIANIDSLSNLDDLVYTILAARKAKRRKSAKAYAIAEGLRRSKRTASGDAGRYTTNSGLMVNKDDNNAYNRVYMPLTNVEEEEGGSSNDNGINGGTSDSTDKGKGSSACEYGKGASRCKDTLLYKRHNSR
ncbi:hypothetical protein P8C59_003666 [Phyllachora maydis]|uniref:Uncharacterized protein n=1 Tax=Phyllachora maydis TaxID=1825666 RepID=A0AAD9M9I1_9PEZI|nr:hypothetical protein P8C59_003666 [Phyllachora maydis]